MPWTGTDSEAKAAILGRQATWASSCAAGVVKGYFAVPRENMPWLTDAIEGQIRGGDGAEFGKDAGRAKIAALHSSSALAVNVFGYWCDRKRDEFAQALGVDSGMGRPRFEVKFSTGVGPRSPNLDVVLPALDGGLVAVESKFTEWMGSSGAKPLRDAYLPANWKRWKISGLAGAQHVAEHFRESPGFKRLDVPQLLKHLLGLSQQTEPWHLKLVWYCEPCQAADEMTEEIARFKSMLGPDAAGFSAITYQELWSKLKPLLGSEHDEYRRYLDERYFAR